MFTFKSFLWCLSLRTGLAIIILLEIILELNITAQWLMIPPIMAGHLAAIFFLCILLYGIARDSRNALWLWVILNAIIVVVILVLVGLVALGIILIKPPKNPSPDYWAVEVVFVFPIAVVQALFAFVAYSYICQLRELENLAKAKDIPQKELHDLVAA